MPSRNGLFTFAIMTFSKSPDAGIHPIPTVYIDTHCHIDSILKKMKLTEFQQLKDENFPAEFEACLTVSCDPHAIDPTLVLLNEKEIYGAFGIHPHDAQHYDDALEERLKQAMTHPKCVAWGEIGLDYHYDFSPRPIQQTVFNRQLKMGVSQEKPLVIHTREAEEDTLQSLRELVPRDHRVHVHCFTSGMEMALALLNEFSHLCLGFTGIITFKGSDELREIARATPLDRMLLETDGPYLAPVPHRGKPAHPGHIPAIAQTLAEVKGVSITEIYAAARENTRRTYGI
jgi:TatD DNase family protein